MSKNFFTHILSTDQELRELLGYPSELVRNKTISTIDEHCGKFIAQSPIVFISTTDQSGACDVSPRGNKAGFVHVIDDTHLVIPERPGNRRLDSLRNILINPYIGMLFVIPSLDETLRINGKAWIIQDEKLLEQMQTNGKKPLVGIGVEVEECFIHCGKAFMRSKLWDFCTWPQKEHLPTVSNILAEHANIRGVTAIDIEKSLKETYEKRLY